MAELDVLVLDPPDGASATAAIVAIHGYGASADDLVPLAGALALPRVRWLFPQGWQSLQHVFGTGWAWFDLPPYHEPGILESRRRLTALLDELAAGGVPLERTVLGGFSQGAVMSLDVGLRYPRPLAGIAALSGYLFAPESLTADLAPVQRRVPVFLAHGTLDEIVPAAGSRAAAEALEALGLPVVRREYEMAHQITDQELADLRAFLAPLVGADGRG